MDEFIVPNTEHPHSKNPGKLWWSSQQFQDWVLLPVDLWKFRKSVPAGEQKRIKGKEDWGQFFSSLTLDGTIGDCYFCRSKVVKHQQFYMVQPNTWNNAPPVQQSKSQTPSCTMIIKMKDVLKKKKISVLLIIHETLPVWKCSFKSFYAWGLPPVPSIFKYWTRMTDPLFCIWGNESTTPRQVRLMEKHVNEGHFSYFAPPSKGLIQEGASLRLITHPNTNLRGGTTLPWGMGGGSAQRDMTNVRSSRGPQAEQVMNLNLTNV